ncbi:hypothetical protein LXN10_10180 [Arcobacter sp. KX21116]|uniref:hypothetical protein n=1 Tax=Arcobacter iocasae TaxID=2906515 RepID=UPI0035D47562
MNEKLLIELLTIIKQTKQPIIKAFEDKNSRALSIDFNSVLENIQKHTKKLVNSIKKEANTFNNNYNNEEEMIKAVKNSFDSINFEVKKLTKIYIEIECNISKNNIQSLLSLQISKKVLYDYITWCEKLENVLLEISDEEVTFIPNIEIESEIINFIVNNTKSNELNCLLPFISGLGLGFMLDD